MNTSTKQRFDTNHRDLVDLIEVRKRVVENIVKTGIQYLDALFPNWRTVVLEERLDLGDPERCVLGQIFGDYQRGLTALGLSASDAVALGFITHNDQLYTDKQLTAAWQEAMTPAD